MKYIMCSRTFPKEHPKSGQPTGFVEKVWNSFRREDFSLPESFNQWVKNFPFLGNEYLNAVHKASVTDCKHTTIRAGSRFKPGDMISLRVWSGAPYRSKQIEFAQVEVKKTWGVEIYIKDEELAITIINEPYFHIADNAIVANNDGLHLDDFTDWFKIHPKKDGQLFTGQIICWNDSIEYSKPLLTEKIK